MKGCHLLQLSPAKAEGLHDGARVLIIHFTDHLLQRFLPLPVDGAVQDCGR